MVHPIKMGLPIQYKQLKSISSLYFTPTSGSLEFASEDGCWSSETCIVNLKLCLYLKHLKVIRSYITMLLRTLDT